MEYKKLKMIQNLTVILILTLSMVSSQIKFTFEGEDTIYAENDLFRWADNVYDEVNSEV